MCWWRHQSENLRFQPMLYSSLAFRGSLYLLHFFLKASMSGVSWPRSGPWPRNCITLPFTKPLWPLRMAALINTIHCASFYTRWGQKFRPQVLTVKAERWTCDLLEWVGRGREQEGRKEDGGEGSSTLQCRMAGFTAACWLHCKHSRKHLIASPWGRNRPTPLLSH